MVVFDVAIFVCIFLIGLIAGYSVVYLIGVAICSAITAMADVRTRRADRRHGQTDGKE
jgi:hypothetical protein